VIEKVGAVLFTWLTWRHLGVTFTPRAFYPLRLSSLNHGQAQEI
jgi:hypothetical protein